MHQKLYSYKDIPFRIRYCKNCDQELPEWDRLCNICLVNAQNDDIFKAQKKMWVKEIYNPWLKEFRMSPLSKRSGANADL